EANGDEELWHFVGGSKGRLERFDINPGPAQSYPYYTVAFGESIVTVATGPVVGRELWIVHSNSVPRVFADIFTDTSVNPSSMPHALTPAGKLLYFVANDIEHGLELWCSDGSEMGTRLVRDIFPGRASSNPTE